MSFQGVKRPDMALTTHSHLAFLACSNGELYLYILVTMADIITNMRAAYLQSGFCKQDWGSTFSTSVACYFSFIFLWVKRPWLFKTGQNLRLPCAVLFETIQIPHRPGLVLWPHHFGCSNGDPSTFFLVSLSSNLFSYTTLHISGVPRRRRVLGG